MKELYRINRLVIICFSTIINKIQMCLYGSKYGKGFVTCGCICIHNKNGTIVLGKNVSINSGAMANPVGGGRTRMCNCGDIIIGDNVGISNTIFHCHTKIQIGEDTCIGGGSRIDDTRENGYITEKAPIIIGKRVFIGADVTIHGGVTIGDEAVIGAGTVISNDVPSREVWAGNPARFIKRLPKC